LGVGLTTLPCKKENCSEASKKFSRILRRKPRPKLGCVAKERRRRRRRRILYACVSLRPSTTSERNDLYHKNIFGGGGAYAL
jgi:hypothetical protein